MGKVDILPGLGFLVFRKALQSFFLLFFIYLFSVDLLAQPAPETTLDYESMISPIIEQVMEKEGIKGISVAFFFQDEETFTRGYGFSNLEKKQAVSSSTIFPVASLTKILTNIAILILVEEGRLNLADPVKKHLPGFNIKSRFPKTREITIDDLLNHYSGLPANLYKGLVSVSREHQPDLLQYLKGQYVAYPPGVKYLYSNIGYEILGLIIEQASGETYEEFVARKVLIPLGMKNSYFSGPHDNDKVSRAYIFNEDKPYNYYPLHLRSGGGLFSNSDDMGLLMQWLIKDDSNVMPINPELKNRMFFDQKPEKVLDVSLKTSWSWIIDDLPEPFSGSFLYKTGSNLYFNSVAAMIPEYNAGLVIMANTAGTLHQLLVLSRLILLKALEKQTGEYIVDKAVIPRESKKPDTFLSNELRGNFLLENYFLQVFLFNDDVILKIDDHIYQLFYNSDGWFSFNKEQRFKVDYYDGKKILFIEQNGFVSPIAYEAGKNVSIDEHYKEQAGVYIINNVDLLKEEPVFKKLELNINDEYVQLSFFLDETQRKIFGFEKNTYNLIPTQEGNLVFSGFGKYQGETIFLRQDEKGYYVYFSGLEFFRPK